jgi:hypothetical protein
LEKRLQGGPHHSDSLQHRLNPGAHRRDPTWRCARDLAWTSRLKNTDCLTGCGLELFQQDLLLLIGLDLVRNSFDREINDPLGRPRADLSLIASTHIVVWIKFGCVPTVDACEDIVIRARPKCIVCVRPKRVIDQVIISERPKQWTGEAKHNNRVMMVMVQLLLLSEIGVCKFTPERRSS